ncbi:kynurenine 3-monooxygenase, mitochondrial precursor [Coelomomyces lativittatus]|nr:kynurenine 3-monooxygenase, mitochondrial precursor [Coelomomyces lativittatus]
MVPFYGQGMNCGFEDIDVLFQLYHPPSSPLSMTETHLFTSPTPNVFSHPIKKTTTTTPKSSKPTTTTTQVLSPSLTKYMKNDLSYSVEKHPNFVDFSNVSSPEDPTTHQQQRIFEMYTAQRRPDILAIVSLAQSNYLEMRSNVISPMHRWRTYLIHFYVNYLVPNPWRPYLGCTPLYTLISFTNVPYHECLQRGRTQFLVSQTCLLSLMVLGSSVISWTGYHGFLTLKRHTSNYLLRSPSTTTLTTLMTEPNMVHSKPPFFNQLVKVSQEGLQWTYSFLKQGMLHLVRTTTMLIQGSSRPLSSSGSRGSGVDGESLHES